MRIIGLTGGLATGKSEVAAELRRLGADVIDADREGHESYRRGTPGWERIVQAFGQGVLDDGGEIDRRKLGELVFSNRDALARLNALIHPLIRQRVKERIDLLAAEDPNVVVVEAALLLEAGWEELTDEVWVVTAPRRVVVDRLRDGRGLTSQQIEERLGFQASSEEAVARADVVIENSGSLEELRAKVQAIWNDRILAKGSRCDGGTN